MAATLFLPRRLRNPRNLPAQRQLPEAQPAQAELAQIRARTSAHLAAVMSARGKLRLLLALGSRHLKRLLYFRVFDSFCCSHAILTCLSRNLSRNPETLKPLRGPERHAQVLQQGPRLVIVRRRGHNR